MLTRVAEGVLVHTSEFVLSNAVVVQGSTGVLVVDPGITGSEIGCLADDLRELGQPVVAGFSTHPDWDHVLWSPQLGSVPRYATARATTVMREQLADPSTLTRIAEHLPVSARIDLDLAYVRALRDGRTPDDPRLGPSARPGWEWVGGIHEWQATSLAARTTDGPAGQGPVT